MMSISNVSAGAAASGYYKEEGYYKSGSPEAEGSTQWFGKAAEEIGLTGPVADQQFAAFLEGQAPDGKLMGRWVDGERQHRPGLDLTFSASKSASIAALVIGDDRITKAHDEAVKAAMTVVEERFAKTRYQVDGKIITGEAKGLIAGIYRHDTSRALDPNLHSHAVIANMVKNDNGTYTALTNEAMFKNRTLITEIYRSEFESRLSALGIATDRGQYGEVNVRGISREVVEAFSKRRQEIVSALDQKGMELSPENAAKATLATRAAKHKDVDRAELHADWRKEALAAGLDKNLLETRSLGQRIPSPEIPKDQQRPLEAPRAGLLDKARALMGGTTPQEQKLQSPSHSDPAAHAVSQAVAHVSERSAVYERAELTTQALRLGHGASFAAVDREIERRIDKGQLIADKEDPDRLTDKAAVALDRSLITTLRASAKTEGVQLASVGERSGEGVLAKKLNDSRTLTEGQKGAVMTSLTGPGRYVGVQGYAGTGKTFMMERVAHYAAQSGYEIKGFAPSHQAVQEMTAVLGAAETVAKVVTAERNHPQDVDNSKAILMVDEAAMLGAKDLRSFMDYAERTGAARVVLVGDTQQLDAVSAGQPFAQLQKAGMPTAIMDEIRRQRDTDLKQAVLHTIKGEIGDAFSRLEGHVQQSEEPNREAASAFLALSPSERNETRVLTLTNAARAEINDAIRQGLRSEGQIGADALSVSGLRSRQLSEAERVDARSFQPGDVVQSLVSSRSQDLQKQQTYRVHDVNETRNSITLQHEGDGTLREVALSETHNRKEIGKALIAYQNEDRPLALGDQLRFRIADKAVGITNGMRAQITALEADRVEVETREGTRISFAADTLAARGAEHDYTATTHAVQGETVDRVIVAMSATERLVNQKSFYVEISRARDEARLITNDPSTLADRVEKETGTRPAALDLWTEERLSRLERQDEKAQDKDKTEATMTKQEMREKLTTPGDARLSDPELQQRAEELEKLAKDLSLKNKELTL